ncbi:hypothetical protein DMENIID0001_088350 [Sergentomyia squamirostris]
MDSVFGQTFMFLTKLAWNSRTTLPLLITALFLAMDFRMAVELDLHLANDHDGSVEDAFEEDDEEESVSSSDFYYDSESEEETADEAETQRIQ